MERKTGQPIPLPPGVSPRDPGEDDPPADDPELPDDEIPDRDEDDIPF